MKFEDKAPRPSERGRRRRGVSEIVAVLVLVAIAVGLGIVMLTFASGYLSSLTGSFGGLVANQGSAAAQQFVVEQATFSFTVPATGALAEIPITLTNSQTSATPTSFQQMVTWDPAAYSTYEATNLGNVRFCATSTCSTELYSWLESCSGACSTGGSSSTSATAWVNLGSNTIAAGGGTLTMYMVFESTSTTFDGVYWGEAPQLSSTYAQYDNGANVFTDYWNFAGTACPTGWTCTGTTINNGISAAYSSDAVTTATFGLTANILDFYGTFPAATSVSNAGFGYNPDVPNDPTVEWAINTNTGGAGCASTNACLQTATTTAYSFLTTFTTTGTQVYSLYWGSTASATAYYGYTNSGTSTTDIPTAAMTIGIYNAQGSQATIGPFYWLRLRAYPPSGVMPTASTGPTVADGANLYVRNVGTVPVTLVSVFIVDQSTGKLIGQFPMSTGVSVGSLAEVPDTTLTFLPAAGNTYLFKVTSSLGNSAPLEAEAL